MGKWGDLFTGRRGTEKEVIDVEEEAETQGRDENEGGNGGENEGQNEGENEGEDQVAQDEGQNQEGAVKAERRRGKKKKKRGNTDTGGILQGPSNSAPSSGGSSYHSSAASTVVNLYDIKQHSPTPSPPGGSQGLSEDGDQMVSEDGPLPSQEPGEASDGNQEESSIFAHSGEEAWELDSADYHGLREIIDRYPSSLSINEESRPRSGDVQPPEDDESSYDDPTTVIHVTPPQAPGATSTEPSQQLRRSTRSRNPSPEPVLGSTQTQASAQLLPQPSSGKKGRGKRGQGEVSNERISPPTPSKISSTPQKRQGNSVKRSQQPENPTRAREPKTGEYSLHPTTNTGNPKSSNNAGSHKQAGRGSGGSVAPPRTTQSQVFSGWDPYVGSGWGTAAGLGSQNPQPTEFPSDLDAPTPAAGAGTGGYAGAQIQPGSSTAPPMPGSGPSQSSSQHGVQRSSGPRTSPDNGKRQKRKPQAGNSTPSATRLLRTNPSRAAKPNWNHPVARPKRNRTGLLTVRQLRGDVESSPQNDLEAQARVQASNPTADFGQDGDNEQASGSEPRPMNIERDLRQTPQIAGEGVGSASHLVPHATTNPDQGDGKSSLFSNVGSRNDSGSDADVGSGEGSGEGSDDDSDDRSNNNSSDEQEERDGGAETGQADRFIRDERGRPVYAWDIDSPWSIVPVNHDVPNHATRHGSQPGNEPLIRAGGPSTPWPSGQGQGNFQAYPQFRGPIAGSTFGYAPSISEQVYVPPGSFSATPDQSHMVPIPEEQVLPPVPSQLSVQGGRTFTDDRGAGRLRLQQGLPQSNAPILEGTQHQFPSPEFQRHYKEEQASYKQSQEYGNSLQEQFKTAEDFGMHSKNGSMVVRSRPRGSSSLPGDVKRPTRGVRRVLNSPYPPDYEAAIQRSDNTNQYPQNWTENQENIPPQTRNSESMTFKQGYSNRQRIAAEQALEANGDEESMEGEFSLLFLQCQLLHILHFVGTAVEKVCYVQLFS